MTRPGRLVAVASVTLAALLLAPAPLARAGHCEPIDNPDPIPGENRDWCHTAEPTDEPDPTPRPTPAPTEAPTQQPAPAATRRPAPPVTATRTTPQATASVGTLDNVEVPTAEPGSTPVVVIDGPVADEGALDVAEPSASASSWIFGFIVGLVIGGFVGRASWGLRRRRRQQIFG